MADALRGVLAAFVDDLAQRVASIVVERLREQPLKPSMPVVEHVPEVAYVDTKTAAQLLGVSRAGLDAMRARGQGPRFIRIGRRIRYAVADLRKGG